MHRLTCSYELSSLNMFEPERACDGNLLDFGFFRYHRASSYVGAVSSVLYFPLWRIWKSP